jgi:hypothetical protein
LTRYKITNITNNSGNNNPKGGTDTITDFTVADNDVINVSATGFGGGLTTGTLDSSQFLSGAGANTATDSLQRFIYDTTSGALFFDQDGDGTGFAAVQIATLSSFAGIDNNSIVVIYSIYQYHEVRSLKLFVPCSLKPETLHLTIMRIAIIDRCLFLGKSNAQRLTNVGVLNQVNTPNAFSVAIPYFAPSGFLWGKRSISAIP